MNEITSVLINGCSKIEEKDEVVEVICTNPTIFAEIQKSFSNQFHEFKAGTIVDDKFGILKGCLFGIVKVFVNSSKTNIQLIGEHGTEVFVEYNTDQKQTNMKSETNNKFEFIYSKAEYK